MKNAAIVILAIIAILNGIYGFMQGIEANRQAERAQQGERRSLLAEDDALSARDRVEKCQALATILQRDLEVCRNQSKK